MSTTATKSQPTRTSKRSSKGRTGKGSKSSAKSKTASAKTAHKESRKKLRPGQLDGLVLGYMKRHKSRLPVSPTAVAHGINRSSGAVANCLGRLDTAGKVKLTNQKPREYDLSSSTK